MPDFEGNGSAMTMEQKAKRLTAAAFALATAMSTTPALAQSSGLPNILSTIFSSRQSDPPAQPQGTTPGASGALPWSGEDGASGHPLMTASAIRQAAANFDNC